MITKQVWLQFAELQTTFCLILAIPNTKIISMKTNTQTDGCALPLITEMNQSYSNNSLPQFQWNLLTVFKSEK